MVVSHPALGISDHIQGENRQSSYLSNPVMMLMMSIEQRKEKKRKIESPWSPYTTCLVQPGSVNMAEHW